LTLVIPRLALYRRRLHHVFFLYDGLDQTVFSFGIVAEIPIALILINTINDLDFDIHLNTDQLE
jgi:hypothetical protein